MRARSGAVGVGAVIPLMGELQAQRKRRPVKPRPPAAHKPWRAMTLTVDPGTHCGAAIFINGCYVDSGQGDGYDVAWIELWIKNARFFAAAARLPLVLVLERPPRGGQAFAGRNPAGPASVIGSRKLWTRTWCHMDTVHRHRCDVYPVSWRAAVLGMCRGPLLERMTLVRASNLAGKVMRYPDEAVATCMGEWASRAGVVGQVLGATAADGVARARRGETGAGRG